MADETQSKVYDVSIKATEALKTLADLRIQSAQLRDEQKALGKVTEDNAEEYYKLDSQIKAINQQASQYQRQVTQSIKVQNQQEASLERLRTQLSLDNAELVKYGKEAENQARKKELQERITATTAELKKQEEALGDHRRSVGDYGKALKDLKLELLETTQQLIVMAAEGDSTSEEYQKLVQRAGELRSAQAQVNNELRNAQNGTENIQALTGAVSGVVAAYGAWKSVTTALGVENEEFEKVMKQLVTVITALNSLQAINNALSKTGATYRAAQNILQKVGVTQSVAENKALAAKNVLMAKGTVATKLLAAATWLWNAALAANPVFLVIAGIAALVTGIGFLISAFSRSNKAAKESKAAMDAYNETLKETETAVNSVNRALADEVDALNLASEKAIDAAKERGASAKEVAELELQLIKDVAEAETAAAEERIEANKRLLAAQERAIRAKERELNTLKEGSKKYKQAAEDLASLKDSYEQLTYSIEADSRAIERNGLKVSEAVRTFAKTVKKAGEDAAKAAKDAAEKALQAYISASTRAQKIQEEMIRARNIFIADSIVAEQAFQRELFEVQQRGEQERLDAQRKANKITAKEYEDQNKLLELKAEQFNANQLKALNDYYATARKDVIHQATLTLDEQIGEITAGYTKAMKQLAEIQPPVMIQGMSQAEYDKLLAEYEAFIYKREEIEQRLTRQMEDEIQAARDEALSTRLKKIDDALMKEYKNDLAKFTDNEREKLRVQNEMLEKQIKQYHQAGADTYELEAQMRANNLALAQLDFQKATIQAGKDAKKRYEARRLYLEAELAAVQGNSDAELAIMEQMRETTEEYWNEQIEAIGRYADAVSEIANELTSLLNANSDAQIQKVQLQYTQEEQALANKYARGLLTEAQYNAEQLKLENKQAKEIAKIERQQAIREKSVKVFNVVTDTAMGIVKAVASSPRTFGLPWSAFVGATGAMQLATILSEPLPKAQRGAFVRGRTHNMGGEQWELERGETVINSKSSSMFLPLLSAINEAGGGVPFTTIGSDGGYSLRSAINDGPSMTRVEMENAIEEAFGNVNIIATIEDIRRADSEYLNIESRGSF